MDATVHGPTPAPLHTTAYICTDPAIDQLQTPFGVHTGKSCPPLQVSRTATGWAFSETCKTGPIVASTKGRAEGSLDSHYQVNLVTTLTPPPVPQAAKTDIHLNATWLGPCPAGTKPGDIRVTTRTNIAPPNAGH